MANNGLVFITKSTFSAQSSVSIDNCFSATYTHYLVKRNLSGSDPDFNIGLRLRVSGVDASGTDYRRQTLNASSTTVQGARLTGQNRWGAIGPLEATSFGYQETWISNPFETVRTTAWTDASYDTDGNIELQTIVYAHDLTTSYSGFTVLPGAGTITGSVSVWGLVKS